MIVDSFAGGGGASLGIEMALGRSPDIAINHDPVALAMHEVNHPDCLHLTESVWKVDLDDYVHGEPVELLWASPDCRHFSKARGSAPTSVSVRGLAWSIVKFARQLKRKKPKVICLENVEEFTTWEDFENWKRELRRLGYKIEMRQLRACDYGAPTIRKRLFIIMRCDGRPIVWPKPTHGDPSSTEVLAGKLKPWVPAHTCIDFSLPCPSIFDTSEEIMEKFGIRAIRPLADNTLKRVAKGVVKYTIEAAEPFIVNVANSKTTGRGPNVWGMDEPLRTITSSPGFAVVSPSVTAVGGGKSAVVSAFLAQHNTERSGFNPGRAATSPLATITTRGTQTQLVSSHLMSMKGSERRDSDMRSPHPTVLASGNHSAEIRTFLVKYYGAGIGQDIKEPAHSVTTRDRFGLVTVHVGGEPYVIVDIGMRMLTPRELFRAQGFPESYIIDRGPDEKPLTKTQQVHKCGNSVSPWVAKAIAAANCGYLAASRIAAE
jgi:DNA (cytosine-5)-methyltransferase 1